MFADVRRCSPMFADVGDITNITCPLTTFIVASENTGNGTMGNRSNYSLLTTDNSPLTLFNSATHYINILPRPFADVGVITNITCPLTTFIVASENTGNGTMGNRSNYSLLTTDNSPLTTHPFSIAPHIT